MQRLEELIAEWDGLAVVSRYDVDTGAWMFICLHDNTLGDATGGTRMAVYDATADGLLDAMRLAEGMTHKWAAVDLPFGGGKAVIALAAPLPDDQRGGLLRRYGRLVEALRGAFRTGEDMGTSSADMLQIAEVTRHVHGFDSAGRKIDPSPYTARGVVSGIEAALEVRFGATSVAGRRILIEGVGNVGRRLAEELAERRAELLLADIDPARAADLAQRLDAVVVEPSAVASAPCDVYAPCAVGATVNSETIPRLKCGIIAGSANNQLAEASDAEALLERGILYVPDFIVNAGGAVAFAAIDSGRVDPEEIFSEVERIGATSRAILEEAADRSETTLAAARRRVQETLARRRSAGE